MSVGKIVIEDEEYAINEEFREYTLQLAEALNMNEVKSASLLLEAQEEADELGKSLIAVAIINYHSRRVCLLECLRLLLKQSLDLDLEEDVRLVARELVGLILETRDGPARNGSLYLRKCLDAMYEIENWLYLLRERLQGALALGQPIHPEFDEIMIFQQRSLGQQHESLGAAITMLIKGNYSTVDDFYKLLDHMPKIDRWSILAVHYVPIITAFTYEYGSADGNSSLRDARMLNKKIMDGRNSSPWILRSLHAATVMWWLAEYSGWYSEQPTGSPVQGVDFEKEARLRSEAFFQALNDGALQCTLSLCSQITPYEWYDPLRTEFLTFLLGDSQYLPQDMGFASAYFQRMVMEQLETFIDAFITNMPDTLRRFKAEEDSQRKKFLNSQADRNVAPVQDFHLERFLALISFSFDNRVEAAQSFWGDIDSNLYGFLQWAAKRQTTPTVSAFCEMLRSISQGEECAALAHEFLLEEGNPSTAKIRRATSLSWAQIFGELSIYVGKLREQSQPSRGGPQYATSAVADDIDEPESVLMLQNYLRLMAHMITESAVVRAWTLSQQEMNVLEILFQLCSSSVPSRLQACAISVVRALLTSKTVDLGRTIWAMTDQWVSGGFNAQTRLSKSSNPTSWAEDVTFTAISGDFGYVNEFCSLLQALIEPCLQNSGLDDQLPFHESLGSGYRMPGVGPYVDFALGRVFATVAPQLEKKLQQRVLNWNILTFVVTALSTFNEDLVLLGNKSNTHVDDAMNTSSLQTYIRLHPFARVMEWMFNDNVVAALLASAHHSIDDVASASPDSPLMLSLIRGIEVMNLIMDLQSTYLDLVRALLKPHSSDRNLNISNRSLTSFEDSVSVHLDLVVDLGLYSGLGNQELAVTSLRLLEKLSASRKLNVQAPSSATQIVHGNRLISALEQDDDLERIAQSLSLSMKSDYRELERGSASSEFKIKSVILDVLFRCLSVSPEKPSLAHALLGFSCTGNNVSIAAGSMFAKGISLFHGIVQLVRDYPDGDEVGVESWAIGLKQKAMAVLRLLWSSKLTSLMTLRELREVELLPSLFVTQRPLDRNTGWDGRLMRDPDFMCTESADAFLQALSYRRCVLEYAAIESQLSARDAIPSLKARLISTFLGSTYFSNGDQVNNSTVFDLLDFFEVEVPGEIHMPELGFFAGLDFSVAVQEGSALVEEFYNIRLVDEVIKLRLNQLVQAKRLEDTNESSRADMEAAQIIQHFLSLNNQRDLHYMRQDALTSWSDLVVIIIQISELDQTSKLALALQAFQILIPKLELLSSANAPEAVIIANLISRLLSQIDFGSSVIDHSRVGGVTNDRLFQIFRTGLRSIGCPGLGTELREILYNICHRYLSGMIDTTPYPSNRRHSIQTVKHVGEQTIDIICDDAYGASTACRISALILLDSLAMLAIHDNSDYIVNSMVRTNFLQILVESIEDLPMELREMSAEDIPASLVFFEWKFSLLLTISQSRIGAGLLINAGLFPAIRSSSLFSVDPDLGIEIDNPEALSKYYKLLLALTKIVVSVVLSRGPQNDQTLILTRSFLVENRSLVVAIFKREAKIGGVSFDDAGVSIEELVELFTLLIAATDFLEVPTPLTFEWLDWLIK